MENFNHTELDILNKLKKISDRDSLDLLKTEVFGKKGIITELFKKLGSLDQNKKNAEQIANDLIPKSANLFVSSTISSITAFT